MINFILKIYERVACRIPTFLTIHLNVLFLASSLWTCDFGLGFLFLLLINIIRLITLMRFSKSNLSSFYPLHYYNFVLNFIDTCFFLTHPFSFPWIYSFFTRTSCVNFINCIINFPIKINHSAHWGGLEMWPKLSAC